MRKRHIEYLNRIRERTQTRSSLPKWWLLERDVIAQEQKTGTLLHSEISHESKNTKTLTFNHSNGNAELKKKWYIHESKTLLHGLHLTNHSNVTLWTSSDSAANSIYSYYNESGTLNLTDTLTNSSNATNYNTTNTSIALNNTLSSNSTLFLNGSSASQPVTRTDQYQYLTQSLVIETCRKCLIWNISTTASTELYSIRHNTKVHNVYDTFVKVIAQYYHLNNQTIPLDATNQTVADIIAILSIRKNQPIQNKQEEAMTFANQLLHNQTEKSMLQNKTTLERYTIQYQITLPFVSDNLYTNNLVSKTQRLGNDIILQPNIAANLSTQLLQAYTSNDATAMKNGFKILTGQSSPIYIRTHSSSSSSSSLQRTRFKSLNQWSETKASVNHMLTIEKPNSVAIEKELQQEKEDTSKPLKHKKSEKSEEIWLDNVVEHIQSRKASRNSKNAMATKTLKRTERLLALAMSYRSKIRKRENQAKHIIDADQVLQKNVTADISTNKTLNAMKNVTKKTMAQLDTVTNHLLLAVNRVFDGSSSGRNGTLHTVWMNSTATLNKTNILLVRPKKNQTKEKTKSTTAPSLSHVQKHVLTMKEEIQKINSNAVQREKVRVENATQLQTQALHLLVPKMKHVAQLLKSVEKKLQVAKKELKEKSNIESVSRSLKESMKSSVSSPPSNLKGKRFRQESTTVHDKNLKVLETYEVKWEKDVDVLMEKKAMEKKLLVELNTLKMKWNDLSALYDEKVDSLPTKEKMKFSDSEEILIE